MITFGPVPSRRLGNSLGINNIPPKACSYSCVYCQVGPTENPTTEPRSFYAPEDVADAVRVRVEAVRQHGDAVDYLTFVPDGEPTLDVHLASAIERVRSLDIPVAVITNGSLLWRREVREALLSADWVSIKVDAADEATWRRVNRPAPELDLKVVREGLRRFADTFGGTLVTETMLVNDINDDEAGLDETAKVVAALHPEHSYLAVPTRPPAVVGTTAPSPETFARALDLFKGALGEGDGRVVSLTGYAQGSFGFSGDVIGDILATTAVHPMSGNDMEAFLNKCQAQIDLAERLVADGKLKTIRHDGQTFYVSRWG